MIGVSALNRYVKSLLDGDAALQDIAIKGEISNFSRNYKSGHCYFSIKDAKASVRAVMFRTQADRLAFTPENGMQVVARGRVTLYERDGAFQLYTDVLFPDGQGAAQLAFEQLKQRLLEEGLFAEEHKKQLPAFPQKVGLVTSQTGAALQDILKVAQARCPLASFVLAHASVQGEAAVGEVVDALQALDALPDCDVIIIARGGGSAEDLWVFNDERIIRAVFACRVPVISAIGHEVDYTILDYVADLRAPTPSAAAEMALPDLSLALGRAANVFYSIENNIQKKLQSCYNMLYTYAGHASMQKVQAVWVAKKRRLYADAARAQELQQRNWDAMQTRLKMLAGQAALVNPYAVFARGYAVATDTGGKPIQSVQKVKPGDNLGLRLADGELACSVTEITRHKEETNA